MFENVNKDTVGLYAAKNLLAYADKKSTDKKVTNTLKEHDENDVGTV